MFPDGKVCISILHPPGEDAFNPQESASERWSPVHTVGGRPQRFGSAGAHAGARAAQADSRLSPGVASLWRPGRSLGPFSPLHVL